MKLRQVRGGPAAGTYDFQDLEAPPALKEELFYEGGPEGAAPAAASPALLKAVEMSLITMEKALKMQAFYQSKGENYQRVRQEAEAQFLTLLEQFGEVELTVTPFQLLVHGEPVYSSEEDRKGISYSLFRDGLRRLSLLPGLTSGEFESLLEVFTARSEEGAEYNTITLLWELDMPHVKYRAADMFMEGVMSAGVGLLSEPIARSQLDALVADLEAAPFPPGDKSEEVQFSRPKADSLTVARIQKERRIKDLTKTDVQDWLADLEQETARLGEDVWQRGVSIIARLCVTDSQEALEQLASEFTKALETLVRAGRWETVQAVCQAMAPHVKIPGRKKEPTPERLRQGRAFQAALAHFSKEDRLDPLAEELQKEEAPRIKQILVFSTVLPPEANPQLVTLAANMPNGAGRDQLIRVLEHRGAELSKLHSMGVASGSQNEALSAIKSLASQQSSTDAREALLDAAHHPSTRVRLEAIRALAGQADDSLVPALAANIGSGLHELSQLSFKLLESLPRSQQGVVLLDMINGSEGKDWPPEVRGRVMDLLARWGGAKVDQYLVEGLSAKNLFRRRGIEEHREQILASIRAMGGPRARMLCQRALENKLPRAARGKVDALLQLLNEERKAK